MKRIICILFLISNMSYGQYTKIIFIDSLGNEIGSNQKNLIYNGIDTIHLDQLYDTYFTHRIGAFTYEPIRFDSILSDSSVDSNIYYYARCKEEVVRIVNSIDINNDGVKELFLRRECYCYVTPHKCGPYGEGGQQQAYSKYEVWDIKLKKKIFEVKSRLEGQVAVSTSVVKSYGYKFDVSIDNAGSFIFSNLSGFIIGSITEMGTYKYYIQTSMYKKQ